MAVLLRLNSPIDNGAMGHRVTSSMRCCWNTICDPIGGPLSLYHVGNRSLSIACFVTVGGTVVIGHVGTISGFGCVCGLLFFVLLVGHRLRYSIGQELKVVEFCYSRR